MKIPTCSFCKKPSVIRVPYSGHSLCRKHFLATYWKRARKHIARNKLVESGDCVGLALSGGKDSTAMAIVMHEIFRKRPNVELAAITIDEGIVGYRAHTIAYAKKTCKQLGIEHHVFSFKEEFGTSIDEIVRDGTILGDLTPCSFCGVLRRTLLNRAAKKLGFTKLACGHNLDDETQSILMNLMRGNDARLMRMGAVSGVAAFPKSFVQRIKPLRTTPERENALFVMLHDGTDGGFEMDLSECPYAGLAFRNDARYLLNQLESRHAGIKYNMLNSFDRTILPVLKKAWRGGTPQKCAHCGDPTSGKVCQACSMLEKVKLGKRKRK